MEGRSIDVCVCIKGLQYFIAKYFQNYFARKKAVIDFHR